MGVDWLILVLLEGEEGLGLNLTGNRQKYNHFVSLFFYKIYSQMTAKFQSGPFELICKLAPTAQASPKGHQWPKQDFIKYAAFLNFSKNFITSTEDAFSWSFLRKMSIFIQTKNPNQCRIFHKKMMESHSCLDLLIAQLRTKIDKFEEWYQFYQPHLKNIKLCLHREATDVEKQPTKKVDSKPLENQLKATKQADLPLKAKDSAQMPTDDKYHDEVIPPIRSQSITLQSRFKRPSFGFESFTEMEPQKNISNITNDHDFFFNRRLSYSYGDKKASNEKIMDSFNRFTSYIGQLGEIFGAQ